MSDLNKVLIAVLVGILAIVPAASAQTDESGARLGPPPEQVRNPDNPANANVDLLFTPLSPCRVCDTRFGSIDAGGCAKGTLFGGGTRDVTIAGLCGVPSGADAVSINITAVPAFPGSPGDLRVAPNPPGAPPISSIVNYQFENTANAADVPIGTGVRVFADGSAADFVVDVFGYYRDVSCQAGTVKAFGQCFETAFRAANSCPLGACSVFAASEVCRLVGTPGRGRLGTGLQLRALQILGILALAPPPGEWTDSVYVDNGVFEAMTIANTQGFATQGTIPAGGRAFRCVFNTLP